MDGLDRLLASISEEADSRIESLKQDAEDYAKRLNGDADAKRLDILSAARTAAENDAAQMIARAESLVRSDRRKSELGRRQSDVGRVIDAALDHLTKKTKDERVTLYAGIIRNSQMAPGEIVLGESDRDIVDLLKSRLPDAFTISAETGPFNGGFVVKRGAIEENLTYELAVRNNRPELAQQAIKLIDNENA